MVRPLDEQVAELDDLDLGDLRARWGSLTGRAAPRVGTPTLRLALAYEMQVKALGGLARGTVLSVQCEPLSTRCTTFGRQVPSCRQILPLGPSGGAAFLEGLTIDEVAFGVEVVLQAGVD